MGSGCANRAVKELGRLTEIAQASEKRKSAPLRGWAIQLAKESRLVKRTALK
jgi:hypothetical protein